MLRATILFLSILATVFTLGDSRETRCDKVSRALKFARDKYLYEMFGDREEFQAAFNQGIIPYDVTDRNVVHELACQIAEAETKSEILEVVSPVTVRMYVEKILNSIKKVGGARVLQERIDILDMFMKWMDDTDFFRSGGAGLVYLPLDTNLQQIESALYGAIDEYGENFLTKALPDTDMPTYRYEPTPIKVTRSAVPRIATALRNSSSVDELATTLELTPNQTLSLKIFFYRLRIYQYQGWSDIKGQMDEEREALETVESMGLMELPW